MLLYGSRSEFNEKNLRVKTLTAHKGLTSPSFWSRFVQPVAVVALSMLPVVWH